MSLAADGDTQRGILTALTALGTVLSVGGLLWGAVELRKEYRKLDWQLRGINIIMYSELESDEQQRLMGEVLGPSGTMNDLTYIREVIRHQVIKQSYESLGWPLAFTLLGVVVGTAAGIWSLWV
jgi:hypothetical protein